MKNSFYQEVVFLLTIFLLSHQALSSERIEVESKFDPDEISWVKKDGNVIVEGEAYIKLEDGSYKGCSGFNIELLPVSAYSDERIFKTYGNNKSGQILLKENPPKFTPDHKLYHDLVIKNTCDSKNRFSFSNVHPGDYYIMAFIIWNGTEGGGVMKRVSVQDGSKIKTVLKE